MAELDYDHFIRKLEIIEERQQKQALEVSEGFSALKSLTEENKRIAEESLKDSESVFQWMNGRGEAGGAKVRLALLEEREKRRDWWVKWSLGLAASCLIAIFAIIVKTVVSGSN